ncbi:MAG: hypothetical protein IPL72_16825 [Sulfuritalea sp.]|nr:hypothetical protein [Sulfuritalea sp.]
MSKYITATPEEILQAIEDGSILALRDREICFVLVEFCTPTESDLLSALSSITEVAAANKAVVDTIVSNLVIVTFGMIDGSPLAAYESFVAAALSKYGKSVKIVYSVGRARVGNIGGAKRMSFSFVHPEFSMALAALSNP